MNTYLKFGLLMSLIIGTLVWLAIGGVSETKTYYKTVAELETMKDATSKRLRVAGDVEPGSIVRKGQTVEFVLTQESKKLRVVYEGSDPLPDTFRDRAQAVADGRLGTDGRFHATRIQAKCASKYEAKPGQQGAPVYSNQADRRS
ncbi:MAG: cytochrome c maturation protein CcmE [Bryobacteraceae bacterium]|nr:cytochrome c maturation protein CcmE [Bryobacteraceae bacterium]MDW8379713.1 cytochrome c maturation protein CcmE [Bryobacterales bacterium]